MLVLSRNSQSPFVVVGTTAFRLLHLSKSRAKFGVIASSDLPVMRGEMLLSIINEELGQAISDEERTALQTVAVLMGDPKADMEQLCFALQHPAVQEILYSTAVKNSAAE